MSRLSGLHKVLSYMAIGPTILSAEGNGEFTAKTTMPPLRYGSNF